MKPSPTDPPLTIGIRADAGPSVGLGHIVRMCALAGVLRSELAGEHRVFVRGNNAAQIYASRQSLPTVPDEGPVEDVDCWIIDLQEGCPPSVAERYRPRCDVLVIMNGVGYSGGDRARFMADLVFYQGCSERPYAMDWDGFEGRWYEGAEWVVIRPQFRDERRRHAKGYMHDPPRVLLSGGGANKGDVLSVAARALSGRGFSLGAIMGVRDDDVEERLEGVEVVRQPMKPAKIMAKADLAVVAYGMTALEFLCLGVPTVAISRTVNHLEGAQIVQKRSGGALLSAGLLSRTNDALIRDRLRQLMEDPEASWKGLDWIEGYGAYRVAREIVGECLRGREHGNGDRCDNG